jgi:FkbM family methyltransferase
MQKIINTNKDFHIYERLKYIEKYLQKDILTILDIGSWHLQQSIEFSLTFKDAKIFAFEPCKKNFELCKKNLNNSGYEQQNNIKIFNFALSNKNEVIPFYRSEENPGATSKYKFNENQEKFFNKKWYQNECFFVQALKLDDWVLENNINEVDIIWIDVQGGELDVFKGAKEILKKTKFIFTEVGLEPYYDGQSLKQEIDVFLENENFTELKESFQLNGVLCEANTIYVNKNIFLDKL